MEPLRVRQPAACTTSTDYPDMIGGNFVPELIGGDATFTSANSHLALLFQQFTRVAKGECISQLGGKRYLIFTANGQVVSVIAGALLRAVKVGGVQREDVLASTFWTESSAEVKLADLLENPQRSLRAFAERMYKDIYGGRADNHGTVSEVLQGLSVPYSSGFCLTKDGLVLAFYMGGSTPGYLLLPYSFVLRYMNALGRQLVRGAVTQSTVDVSWVRVRDQLM
jgi:hypothetical protein